MADDQQDAAPKPADTRGSMGGWTSRKLWFGVGLQACAMYSRYVDWIDGAQLVAWSGANALYYVGGNVGTSLATAVQNIASAVLARPKQ